MVSVPGHPYSTCPSPLPPFPSSPSTYASFSFPFERHPTTNSLVPFWFTIVNFHQRKMGRSGCDRRVGAVVSDWCRVSAEESGKLQRVHGLATDCGVKLWLTCCNRPCSVRLWRRPTRVPVLSVVSCKERSTSRHLVPETVNNNTYIERCLSDLIFTSSVLTVPLLFRFLVYICKIAHRTQNVLKRVHPSGVIFASSSREEWPRHITRFSQAKIPQ